MASRAKIGPPADQSATATSKGQVTIPVEIRRFLGAKAGDKLTFSVKEGGVTVARQTEEFPFNKFRGMGTGIPELDNGSIDDIVRWFREARGHDAIDDLILGTDR